MSVCFSTAYLPPIAWFRALKAFEEVQLEAWESWQKQTYRNRCYILGPNGPQMLNIPILHNENKNRMGTVEISYAQNWRHTHWQAIQSAYGNAPFYEVLATSFEAVYREKPKRLFDLNLKLIELCLGWLRMETNIKSTSVWEPDYETDLREEFHPKKARSGNFPRYPQVFDDQQDFTPNLSILDLLMNEGPAAYDYL